jgi:hypothetical protein
VCTCVFLIRQESFDKILVNNPSFHDGGVTIGKLKWHDQVLIQPIPSWECSLRDVFWTDLDLMITRMKIYLGEYLCTDQLIKQDINTREWIFVLDSDSIQRPMRNQVVSSLVWLWWVIDLTRFQFESGTVCLFYLYLCFIGESYLLVSWCASGRYGTMCSDEDRGSSRRPGVEDQEWSHMSDTQ